MLVNMSTLNLENEELFQSYSKLIWYIANNNYYGVDKNDLYQVGWLALLDAYKKYRAEKGTKFSSYAYPAIKGAMYKLACSKMVKVSRDLIHLKKDIERASDILTQLNGWVPSLLEIAQFLGHDVEEIKQALECVVPIVSMDDEKEESRNLHESIAAPDAFDIDDHILLTESIDATLNPMEKEIIYSRYYEDLTQAETAEKLGINQVKVSRYEKRSLTKLHDYINL